MDKPWRDTLWMDCLFELMAKARSENKESVEFADVDKLVIEKSKVITEYKFGRADNKGGKSNED